MRAVSQLIVVAALMVGALTGIASAAKTLEIFFIDVEGGQSTLIVTPAGESLLIDTSSTNIYVAEALQGHRGLTAITNSAPIAQRLSQGQGSKVMLAGGEVRGSITARKSVSSVVTEMNTATAR